MEGILTTLVCILLICNFDKKILEVLAQPTWSNALVTDTGYQGSCIMDLQDRDKALVNKVTELKSLINKVKECEAKVELTSLENRTRKCEAKLEELTPLKNRVRELEAQLQYETTHRTTSTEYLFALTRGVKGRTDGTNYIIAWSKTDTKINLTIGASATTYHTAKANTPLYITVSGQKRLSIAGVAEDKGILVQADHPVHLILYNYKVDYMLLLPTSVLGTDFLAAGYTGRFHSITPLNSALAVVALQDGTSVTATRDGSTVFSTTLNARQAYTYLTTGDVTGLQVTADKPASVMSGGDCLYVPVGQYSCSGLSSQILPRSRWGRNYVVVSLPPRTCGMLMRVMATVPNTVVTLSDGQTSTITTAEHWELDLPSSVGYIVDCSQPCMVWLMNKGDCDDDIPDSSPFQIMVPAIDMWPTVPMLVPFASGHTSDRITVMTLTSDAAQMTLNGTPIPNWNVIANSIYSWVHVTTDTNVNTLDHADPTVRMMAFMTSHHGPAYGAPIGIVP